MPDILRFQLFLVWGFCCFIIFAMEYISVWQCWSESDEQLEEGTFVSGSRLLKGKFRYFVMHVYTFYWTTPPPKKNIPGLVVGSKFWNASILSEPCDFFWTAALCCRHTCHVCKKMATSGPSARGGMDGCLHQGYSELKQTEKITPGWKDISVNWNRTKIAQKKPQNTTLSK